MKQEASNTFSEGLNYDLNPTTTPNNVLTDCINGTFLTFNGDELALQNDAGNTSIPTPVAASVYDPLTEYNFEENVYTTDGRYYKCISLTATTAPLTDPTAWSEWAVKLSDGFYPIGIKEYGGVLYIVSGKKPDIIAVEYDSRDDYALGDIVYKDVFDDGINYYYQSLIDNNGFSLPAQSNTRWLYIGLEKDYINKYGFIEFGSYPSPEMADPAKLDTALSYSIVNNNATVPSTFKDSLYAPKIINNSSFRAGVYVSFVPNMITLNPETITLRAYTYDEATNVVEQLPVTKSFYKVRLLHQLTNGYIDLTDDVWEKYAIFYKTTTGADLNIDTFVNGVHYWFTDPEFRYYCPHNFKGKLAITVELEELDIFSSGPISIEPGEGAYIITFPINYGNSAGWNVDIIPQTATLVYTTDGSEPDYITIPLTTTILPNDAYPDPLTLPMFTLTLDSSFGGQLLRYKILPDFYYQMLKIDREFFPQEFLDMHTIVGSRLITTETDDVAIRLESDSNNCEITEGSNTGFRIVEKISIINSSGFYLDNENELSGTDKYQFMLDTSDEPISPDVWVAKYTYDPISGKAVIVGYNDDPMTGYPLTNKEYLTTLINDTVVRVYDPTCSYITLIVNVNQDYGIVPIVVTQDEVPILGLKISNLEYRYLVRFGVAVRVRPVDDFAFETSITSEYNATLLEDTSINFGLPIKIEVITTGPYDYVFEAPGYTDHWFINMLPEVFYDEIGLPEVIQTNILYELGYANSTELVGGLQDNLIFFYRTTDINNLENRATYTVMMNTPGSHIFDNLRTDGIPTGDPIDIAIEGTKSHIFYLIYTNLSSTNVNVVPLPE